jgi:hypothetical protein
MPGDELEDLPGKRLIVHDARLAHQGGIRREASDQRVARAFEYPGPIGSVGEDLHGQVVER